MIARRTADLGWLWLPVLIVLSLAFKVNAWVDRGGVDQGSLEAERTHIAAGLKRAGWLVRDGDPALASVAAVRRACRLDVTAVDPRGFHRSIVALMQPAGSDLFYMYRGARYAEQPILRTWLDHQIWARAREIGVRLPRAVPLAVIATGCGATRVGWEEAGWIP